MLVHFSLFSWFFCPTWRKSGLRDENIGRDLHFAPVDGPRTFLKNYFWSRYYCNFGFSIIDWFFELFMASPAKTTILTSFGPIWSLYFRSQYLSLSRFCQFYVIFSAAVLKKNLLERRLAKLPSWCGHNVLHFSKYQNSKKLNIPAGTRCSRLLKWRNLWNAGTMSRYLFRIVGVGACPTVSPPYKLHPGFPRVPFKGIL